MSLVTQDIAAERSVLGAMMLEPENPEVTEVISLLEPGSFSHAGHGHVFAALRELFLDGTAPDELTIADKLRAMGKLDAVGGSASIVSIVDATPSAANVSHYARIVRELWLRRRLLAAAETVKRTVQDKALDTQEALERAVQTVTELAHEGARGELVSGRRLAQDVFKALQVGHQAGIKESGTPTGFYALDTLLGGGLQKSELAVLAGRPSMGKTALGLEIAANAIHRSDETALVISLEMSKESLMHRMIASRARVDARALRSPGHLGANDWPKLSNALAWVSTDKMQICDASGLSILDIRAKARVCKARHGLGLVVIDYLGLIRPTSTRRNQNRERDVAEMSAGLKALAKDLEVPVLCLSQLSRANESRDDKRPRLSDLRDSGAIEQDADVVMFVHREGYYKRKGKNDNDRSSDDEDKSAEVIVAKNRNGPTSTVELGWEGRFARFYNLEARYA